MEREIMAIQKQHENRFIQTMPTKSFLVGWDVPWIPNSTNSHPRYAIDYSNSGLDQPIGFDLESYNYLTAFSGFKLNAELRRISYSIPHKTVFRKSLSSELFSIDSDIDKFREFILMKKPELTNLKEYVFEEGGLVDPIRTTADLLEVEKEDVKKVIGYGKLALFGAIGYFIITKVLGDSKK